MSRVQESAVEAPDAELVSRYDEGRAAAEQSLRSSTDPIPLMPECGQDGDIARAIGWNELSLTVENLDRAVAQASGEVRKLMSRPDRS